MIGWLVSLVSIIPQKGYILVMVAESVPKYRCPNCISLNSIDVNKIYKGG
jgi:hypothetical protein